MRKKIPTITRPDPAYAASLLQDVGGIPERGELEWVAPIIPLGDAVAAEKVGPLSLEEPVEAPEAHGQTTQAAQAPAETPTGPRTSRPTRKIDIRVNALARQEAALQACGVDPAHVIRAALRRAVKGWHLSPDYVPPSQDQRTRITAWRARTSLAVDTTHLQVLLRDHDPLDVLSKWALIRGQVEPRVWAEIDTVLDEIAAIAASRQESESPEAIDRHR